MSPLPCSSCILFSGGSDYKLLVMQSPHCALQCHDASCLSRQLWSLSQEHIVILEVACVCLTEARISRPSSVTPLALVCKGVMTDSDPSSRHHPTPPQPSPHIPVLIYEGQDEQERCAALVAAVKWSDFSYLDEANLSWSRCPG